jgi:hypothetical protein
MINELQPGKFGDDQEQIFKSLFDYFNQMAQEW